MESVRMCVSEREREREREVDSEVYRGRTEQTDSSTTAEVELFFSGLFSSLWQYSQVFTATAHSRPKQQPEPSRGELRLGTDTSGRGDAATGGGAKKKRLSLRPIKLKAPRLSRGCVRKEDGRTLKEREKRDKNEDSVNYTTEEDAPGFSPHLFLTSSQ